jgi:hypothetical protein
VIRYAPLAPMSPYEDIMGSNVHKDNKLSSNNFKTKTLLLENYKNMLSNMHQNTSEKARIQKMIEELTESLMNEDVYIKDFK